MALILNIETATKACSVALSDGGEVIALEEYYGEYAHAEKLTVFADKALKKANLSFKELNAVAVSKGPGSYTGLRIGVSAAKGFCYALDIPLIAVNTLQHMALSATEKLKGNFPDNSLFCPMIDARRMEVYSAVFDAMNKQVEKTEAKVIDVDSFNNLLSSHTIYFFGDGAEKCREKLARQANAVFLDNIFPSAAMMPQFSESLFNSASFEDLAYFEPFYLKDFITTVPKSKP